MIFVSLFPFRWVTFLLLREEEKIREAKRKGEREREEEERVCVLLWVQQNGKGWRGIVCLCGHFSVQKRGIYCMVLVHHIDYGLSIYIIVIIILCM